MEVVKEMSTITNLKQKNIFLMISLTLLLTLLIFRPMTIQANEENETVELTILSSWGTEYLYVQDFLIPYIEKINNETDGRIHVTWVGPEAVSPFEQLQPLSNGIFDILFTHPSYHVGEIAAGIAMDLITASPEEIRAAGFYEILDKAYKQKANAKVLSMISGEGVGYHIMLKKPLEKADFTGLKLRSTPTYDVLIIPLGGSTVQLPVGEVYSALERGVVDGACWPVFGALDYKWYEVVDYQLRPQFGQVSEILLINLDTWESMPEELQNLLMEITIEMETNSYDLLAKAFKKEEEELVNLGMKLNVLPEDEGEKLLQTFYDNSWEKTVLKLSPDFGPQLKKLVEELERREE